MIWIGLGELIDDTFTMCLYGISMHVIPNNFAVYEDATLDDRFLLPRCGSTDA